MKHKTISILLFGIVLLAAFLRLYRLDNVPPGVNRDEASIGYTAYSLLTTGKDEYGRAFPLSFESFGDWKLPLYIYTTIPFVAVFGLSELAVRLPSAIAGTLTVFVLYFLVLEILRGLIAQHPYRIHLRPIALLSSALLAIMPWHIHISRVESEAIVSTLFTVIGSLMLLRSFRKKCLRSLIISAIVFSATYYTYHGSHITTSLLLFGAFILFQKHLYAIRNWWIALCLGATLTGFILFVTLSADHTKISGISIFGDPTVIHTNIELPRTASGNPDSFFVRLRYNRVGYAISAVTKNYLASYGPKFLFIKGAGNHAHNIQTYANLHPISAPFLLLGVLLFASFWKHKPLAFVLWWLAASGIAAAITKDAPHSNRMLAVTPAMANAIAMGIAWVVQAVPKKTTQAVIGFLFLGYMLAVFRYTTTYFTEFPIHEAQHWGYAYKQLTPVVFNAENSDKKIIMTNPQESPYIYLLFYSGYPPKDYQAEAIRYPISDDGFTDVAGFGRFSFRSIKWDKDISAQNTIIIARPIEIPDYYRKFIIDRILLPDNAEYVVLLEYENKTP